MNEAIIALRAIRAQLEYNTFQCPGGHRRYVSEAEGDRRGREPLRSFHRGLGKFQSFPYVDVGACDGAITIELDHETDDMGGVLYEYPVAYSEGSCARALGLTDGDDEYQAPIWGEYAERKRLLCVLRNTCKNLGVYKEVFAAEAAE